MEQRHAAGNYRRSKVTHIEASHFEAGTAYAAVDRHRLDDLRAICIAPAILEKHGR